MIKLSTCVCIALFLAPSLAQAEAYLDIGLAAAKADYVYAVKQECGVNAANKYYCTSHIREVSGVMGAVEIGYTEDSYTVYYSHLSLINDKDGRGLNMLGIKKRIRLFD